MPAEPAIVDLRPEHFGSGEAVLARWAGMTASTFRYATGVAALRLENAAGHLILLPFQGQQIWDAVFHGRRLTMGSMFDEPVETADYLENYGGFLLHCGATAMGNPGPEDDHRLHGDLPNARYARAALLIGEDGAGPYLGLTGVHRRTVAFTHNYEARPVVRLRPGHGRLEVDVEIRNLKGTAMELMYLAHINFRPVDGGRMVDTVPDTAEAIRLRTTLPSVFTPSEHHTALIAELTADIARHREIAPGGVVDPELVMGLTCRADSDGWAHAMQVLPDGTADFVSHRPGELDHAVRWITRTANQQALGLVLPATAEADGYTAEKAKGNVRVLPPGGAFTCRLRCGALDAAGAAGLAERIAAVA